LNICIYARFSSHSQNEQSIEGQLKVCYDFAERNGYKVISEYIDRAISGTGAENRPEFQRMITDSAKRQFQAVLVYQLDRLTNDFKILYAKKIPGLYSPCGYSRLPFVNHPFKALSIKAISRKYAAVSTSVSLPVK
jgi:hypothetical protein